MSVVVLGQVGRDLVLEVRELPDVGGSTDVIRRHELLGGKGANQAVGLRQLGAEVALVAVVGTDPAGDHVLDDAERDGIDTSHVVRRGTTALLLDLVVTQDRSGTRRLFEDVPTDALLTPRDVGGAADVIAAADTVCLQLQQPIDAMLVAARIARDAGARIVLDGGIAGAGRDELLSLVDVVRADAHEAQMLTGDNIRSRHDAERAAETLLAAGPTVVAIAVPGKGDLVATAHDRRMFALSEAPVVDPTGAGDAFVAGLVTGLRRGDPPIAAGELAAAAAAATVTRLGGRPDLSAISGR